MIKVNLKLVKGLSVEEKMFHLSECGTRPEYQYDTIMYVLPWRIVYVLPVYVGVYFNEFEDTPILLSGHWVIHVCLHTLLPMEHQRDDWRKQQMQYVPMYCRTTSIQDLNLYRFI